jgi:hypothetical protein
LSLPLLVIGYVGGRIAPETFRAGGGHGQGNKSFGPALIDDDSPRLPHTRFAWQRLTKVLLAGLVLWLVPMLWLWVNYGWEHTFTQMSWFFYQGSPAYLRLWQSPASSPTTRLTPSPTIHHEFP